MHSELLPVVDEYDRIIDYQARHIVHANKLRHRAVHILVFNDLGQLFLQKRSLLKDLNAGLWDTSAAGHVDADEDYEFSAQREIFEELGIDGKGLLEFLFKLPAQEITGMEFIQVFRCLHNGPFTLAADEIEEGRWYSSDQISQRVQNNDPKLTLTFKNIWQHIENRSS